MELDFRLIHDESSKTSLGESPVWDPETGVIWWVDIQGKKLCRAGTDGQGVTVWNTPEQPGFVVLTASDKPALGMQTGIYLFSAENETFELLVPFGGEGQRFNDACVDPSGRLWTSTMALDAAPGLAAIHLISGDLELQTRVSGLSIPNGLALDAEFGRLYFSDSAAAVQTIWFQSPAIGGTGNADATTFASTAALGGRPDGAALDSRGHYWIAGVDGAALYVFDRTGHLERTIPVPFPAPTKLAFVGEDARAIAVTSKDIGEEGGYLALANLPDGFAPGTIQPYWQSGV